MTTLTLIRGAFTSALEMPPADREALLATLPPEVRDEVLSLLAAHESAGAFLNPSGDVARPDGERIGPYLLLEKIGQGGMGAVYRACRDDGEFQREVAIKLVGGRLFAPEAERRFIVERRILALLDHPNIVHMIDGGIWQGYRYLVMELIPGEPITKFAAGLPIPERLRLFQSVCSAIHYAHQHLIIHRDLKPQNIIATAEGQVKVLDFGIASLLDTGPPGESGKSTTGLNPMTLSSASPEQVRGDRLTLATDIYSLGLLLHEMLTGENPQASGARMEIEQRIVSETPLPPSKLTPGLSPDLDAIVLKSLAKNPAERYASAEEMSADVGRFLDGRPVLARPPSKVYYLARFCARNKALTAIAAALVLAILGGLAAFAWQARRAEQQRAIAERRFDQARAMIYTVIHDIQPKLAEINGTIALRTALIEKTLVYLEALGKDAHDNPALTRELIEAYDLLWGVTADAANANVGDHQRASQILTKAEALADTLLKIDPSSPASMGSLIDFYRTAARNASFYGSRAKARVYAGQALTMAERLVSAAPGDLGSQDQVAFAAATLADVIDDQDEKIRLYGRSLAIWDKALTTEPTDLLRQRVALMYKNLSSNWTAKSEFPRALDCALKAQALDEELLARNPSSPTAQMALAFDLGSVGTSYRYMKDYPKAIETMRQNVALREKVAAANPDDRRAVDRLAYSLSDLASTEKLQGDRTAARRDFVRTMELYQRLRLGGPLVPQSLYRFATANYGIGEIESDSGNRSAGCTWFRKSIKLLDEFKDQDKIPPNGADSVAEIRERAASCPK